MHLEDAKSTPIFSFGLQAIAGPISIKPVALTRAMNPARQGFIPTINECGGPVPEFVSSGLSGRARPRAEHICRQSRRPQRLGINRTATGIFTPRSLKEAYKEK